MEWNVPWKHGIWKNIKGSSWDHQHSSKRKENILYFMSVDDSMEIHWFLVQTMMIPQVTFNIHRTFPLHKGFFRLLKCSSIFFSFLEPFTERFFMEPNILWHRCRNTLLEPLFLSVWVEILFFHCKKQIMTPSSVLFEDPTASKWQCGKWK